MNLRLSIILLVTSTVGLFGCDGKKAWSIEGVWLGQNETEQDIELTFRPDGTMKLQVDAQFIEGEYFIESVDSRIYLDTKFGENHSVETILEFIEENKIRMEDNEPGKPRPMSFSDASVTFDRKQ